MQRSGFHFSRHAPFNTYGMDMFGLVACETADGPPRERLGFPARSYVIAFRRLIDRGRHGGRIAIRLEDVETGGHGESIEDLFHLAGD